LCKSAKGRFTLPCATRAELLKSSHVIFTAWVATVSTFCFESLRTAGGPCGLGDESPGKRLKSREARIPFGNPGLSSGELGGRALCASLSRLCLILVPPLRANTGGKEAGRAGQLIGHDVSRKDADARRPCHAAGRIRR